MKVLHCIASMDKSAGGTTTAVLDILEEQSKNIKVELYTLNSEDQIEISIEGLALYSENAFFLDYSIALNKSLAKSTADIFHGHAIWNLPIHQMCTAARKMKKPYIISIHGMLHEWSLQQSSLKKKMALLLYQDRDLRNADCLHATSIDEAKFIRKQGYRNPIAVISNGISVENYPLKPQHDGKKKIKRLLFLSRIHQQKGIEYLLEAWSKIDVKIRENWILDICGMGNADYIDFLNSKCEEMNITDSISFSGALFGKSKLEKFQSADLFVLPSFTENFGMVVAEALSCGVPVITTKGTPWEELEMHNAGKWIDLNEENLLNTMSFLMTMKEEQLQEMGLNGRKLIEENYSIESVAERFILLYQWIITGKNKPDFVYLDK